MSIGKSTIQALRQGVPGKTDVRTQFGALCYRVRDRKPQVLLVTSRGTGRWIIPKGWPMDGLSPAEAAQREAWEEAGAKGHALPDCLGVFSYVKQRGALPCVVAVFPLEVTRLADSFPEAKSRKRKWFSPRKAAAQVEPPELAAMLRRFDPGDLLA